MMRTICRQVDESVSEIVEQVAAMSSGIDGIFPAIQLATSHSVISRFSNTSIHSRIKEYTEKQTRLVYVKNRFKCLFELMAMLPDSEPAFSELSIVLRNTRCDLEELLKWSLESCRKKLLSPALPTDTIVGQFVHGAKMFRVLDPTGLLLDRCSLLAKEYLLEKRNKSELDECVFKLLSVLLEAIPIPSVDNNQHSMIGFDVKHEEYLAYYSNPELIDDEWLPDPPAAGKVPIRHSSKTFNPLAVLANFSDRQSLFTCLHESIMKQIMSGQQTHGKILKRIGMFANGLFGKAACGKLLVMLHDAQQSREVFGKIKDANCTPLVISESYWPMNSESNDKIELPNLEILNQEYKQAKPNRHLVWNSTLSLVDVDLKIDEITFTINGVPFCAFKVMERLLETTALSTHKLQDQEKEGLMYWVERGFCRLQPDNTLILCKPSTTTVCDLQTFRQYLFDNIQQQETAPKPNKIPPHIIAMVSAMLTNLGPMPSARIHAMLVTMSGLKEVDVQGLTDWLLTRPEVQYDPVTGVFCRQTKQQ